MLIDAPNNGSAGAVAAVRAAFQTLSVAAGVPLAFTLEYSRWASNASAPPTLALSAAFAALGAARARGELIEFGVSAASLESVFLRFARAQEAADERDRARAAAGAAGEPAAGCCATAVGGCSPRLGITRARRNARPSTVMSTVGICRLARGGRLPLT
jgi:hypothetical protein